MSYSAAAPPVNFSLRGIALSVKVARRPVGPGGEQHDRAGAAAPRAATTPAIMPAIVLPATLSGPDPIYGDSHRDFATSDLHHRNPVYSPDFMEKRTWQWSESDVPRALQMGCSLLSSGQTSAYPANIPSAAGPQ